MFVASTKVTVEAGTTRSEPTRRTFLGRWAGLAMTTALVASYGTFGWMAGRFLIPTRGARRGWLLVSDLASFGPGATRTFVAPSGERIVVAHRGAAGDAAHASDGVDAFVALSSTCPHLGCQVGWQPQEQRFFCPCHNGTFAPDGRATGGPPFDAGQSLPRYPLRIESGLLYIEVKLGAAVGGAAS
jgi:Rieske Fe-S protein